MQETDEEDEREPQTNHDDPGCIMSFLPKRYMVSILAMFGLFNAYTLRVNLSIAIVTMVNNVTKSINNSNGVKLEVCKVQLLGRTMRNRD